ncbi:MAG: LacI family DNA-binding transcriptional regulator [Desulfitobacterium hafniense]|nr:LacI family DNA-binding transcriptional regulator [Desulfitobacterium hafniense]
MTTIKDVARLAQVSVGTVSHVFNKPECVSPETIEKVKAAAKELNYFPNRIARGLVRAKTQIIGLVVSNIHNAIYSGITKAVEKTLKSNDYNVMLINTDYSHEKEVEAVNFLLESNVDGVIFGSSSEEGNDSHLLMFTDRSIPVVIINRNVDSEKFDQIIYDTIKGSHDAIAYLLSLGHRRIGFLGGPFERNNLHTATYKRYLGYKLALEEYGITVDENIVISGLDITYEEGYRLALELLGKSTDIPTALFVPQDDMAIGAMGALASKGIAVPDDMSIIGFANHFYARYAVPPLTTVNIPSYEAGKLAAELLLEKMQNYSLERTTTFLPCDLIIRQSTKQR